MGHGDHFDPLAATGEHARCRLARGDEGLDAIICLRGLDLGRTCGNGGGERRRRRAARQHLLLAVQHIAAEHLVVRDADLVRPALRDRHVEHLAELTDHAVFDRNRAAVGRRDDRIPRLAGMIIIIEVGRIGGVDCQPLVARAGEHGLGRE